MPCTLGVTRIPITLLVRGATVGIVAVDEVAVDGNDGGSVEGGGVQAFVVGPAHEKVFA